MSAADGWAGVVQVATLVLLLVVAYRPVGDWMARVYTSPRHTRTERGAYRLIGVDPDAEMAAMVGLQNAYAANARVLGTVQAMWDSLLAAVR